MCDKESEDRKLRYLIINADDFGRYKGVSQGIIDAHLLGIVTSTTAMVNCVSAPADLEKASIDAPDLKIGLHLNLTYGKPLSPPNQIPTLVGTDGFFRNPSEPTSVFLKWETHDLYRELSAQIKRFIALTGRLPTHLDAHYHSAFFFPRSLEVTLALATKYNLPMRRPPSIEPMEKASSTFMQYFPNAQPKNIVEILSNVKSVLQTETARIWPDYLELGFSRPNISIGYLSQILARLPQGVTEIMCHPAYMGRSAPHQYRSEREKEVAILSDVQIKKIIDDGDIKQISFAHLGTQGVNVDKKYR